MTEADRLKYLRVALVVVGAVATFGFWPLTRVWPSGWVWHQEGRDDYLEMLMGVYATLGVFLMLAARNPLKNLSLIWFTVWSSVVHATLMFFQSFSGGHHLGHLLGDVPVLFVAAALLGFLTPRQPKGVPARQA